MPLYEYRCQDCGERITVRHERVELSRPVCPLCGGTDLIRLISRVSIITSAQDRVRELSWVDRDVARRLRSKASGRLNPGLRDALDAMESDS